MKTYTAADIARFIACHKRGGDWSYDDLLGILDQARRDAMDAQRFRFYFALTDPSKATHCTQLALGDIYSTEQLTVESWRKAIDLDMHGVNQ